MPYRLIICIVMLPAAVVWAGIQDDIDALGASGGTVVIPNGTTVVSSSIIVPNYVSLVGAGPGATLQAAPSLTGPIILNATPFASNAGLRFEGFRIIGTNAADAGSGIKLSNVENAICKDLEISQCANGIEMVGDTYDVIIKRCTLHHNGVEDVFVHSGCGVKGDSSGANLRNILVTDCTIYSNYFNGIHFRYSSNLRFFNNYIYDHESDTDHREDSPAYFAGDDCIKLFLCDDIVALGNNLEESKNAGIEYWACNHHISMANYATKSNDYLNGAGNGCAFTHAASQGYWGQGYLHLANVTRDNVFGPAQENNEAPEGNPLGIINANIVASDEHQGLHLVHCHQLIAAHNICRNNGEFDPPKEGWELSGTIVSGGGPDVPSGNLNFHANMTFDDRADRDQMYGVFVRANHDSSISDNIIVNSEILDLAITSGAVNVVQDHNLYHNPAVRFVVEDATAPGNADPSIAAALTDLGYTVSYYDDDDAHPGDLSEDVVLISETVASPAVGDGYRGVAVPVMMLHPSTPYYMELADTGVNSGSQLYLTVTTLDHYITSNLIRTGFVQIASASRTFGYINGNVTGQSLAHLIAGSDQHAIVAIEAGTPDQQGVPTPDRRVFFCASKDAYSSFSASGTNLFQRALEWVLGAE